MFFFTILLAGFSPVRGATTGSCTVPAGETGYYCCAGSKYCGDFKTQNDYMTSCDDAKTKHWDYGYWYDDTSSGNSKYKWKRESGSSQGEKWYQQCPTCKDGKYDFASPINIDTDKVKTKDDYKEKKGGEELQPITFSMPYKYGKYTGNSYKVKNAQEGLVIYIPDGTYNSGYNDDGKGHDFDTKYFKVWGGALGYGKYYCIKKVIIKWAGYDDTTGTAPTYNGAEHTIDDTRHAMEIQFWAYDCKYYSTWDDAVENNKVAAFSTIYEAYNGDPYIKDGVEYPTGMDNSLYKIIKYYVKNQKTTSSGGRRLAASTTEKDCPVKLAGYSPSGGRRLGSATCARRRLGFAWSDCQKKEDYTLMCPGDYVTMKSENFPAQVGSDYCGPEQYIDIHQLLPTAEKGKYSNYYYYKGGFTTPDYSCQPNSVKWHIFKDVKKIDQALIDKLSKYIFSAYQKNGDCKNYGKYNLGRFRAIQNSATADYQDPYVYKYTSSAAGRWAFFALLNSALGFLLL